MVLANVNLGWHRKIELLIRRLFHQVEHRVFQHEFHELYEWLLHEHAFSKQFIIIDAGDFAKIFFIDGELFCELWSSDMGFSRQLHLLVFFCGFSLVADCS